MYQAAWKNNGSKKSCGSIMDQRGNGTINRTTKPSVLDPDRHLKKKAMLAF